MIDNKGVKKMAKKRGNGEGSISQRKDGTWVAAATVGYDVEKGKPVRKYFYGKKRGEVKDKLNDALNQVKNGNYKDPVKVLFAEWLNTWLNDYMKPSLRSTTWESYQVQVEKHIKPNLGHIRLNLLQTEHLQKLYNEKLKGGRADGKPGGLSPRSVRYIHIVIHGALEQAKKEGKIIINPADAVKLPKQDKKEIKHLDATGVSILLRAARETKHFPAYYLELSTGLRRGELLALRWQDIDFKSRNITVNQGLVRTKEGLKFQEPKNKLANRTISIPKEVMDEIKFHRKRQMTEIENAGEAYKNNNLLFCNELGQPLCPRGFTRHFERLLKRCNDIIVKECIEKGMTQEQAEKVKIPKIPFHSLRHTFATMSLQEGVDMKTTQENLGHFDPAFTLRTYSGVTKRMKTEATDKIGNLLNVCMKDK